MFDEISSVLRLSVHDGYEVSVVLTWVKPEKYSSRGSSSSLFGIENEVQGTSSFGTELKEGTVGSS